MERCERRLERMNSKALALPRTDTRRLVDTTNPRGRWGYQCTRIKRNGDRCGNWAIVGSYVCRKHGGQLPVVREAARRRLAILAIDATRVLSNLLTECDDPRIQLRTAKLVLGYNGINWRTLQQTNDGRTPALEAAGAPLVATSSTIDKEIEALLTYIDGAEQRLLEAGVETATPST